MVESKIKDKGDYEYYWALVCPTYLNPGNAAGAKVARVAEVDGNGSCGWIVPLSTSH